MCRKQERSNQESEGCFSELALALPTFPRRLLFPTQKECEKEQSPYLTTTKVYLIVGVLVLLYGSKALGAAAPHAQVKSEGEIGASHR